MENPAREIMEEKHLPSEATATSPEVGFPPFMNKEKQVMRSDQDFQARNRAKSRQKAPVRVVLLEM